MRTRGAVGDVRGEALRRRPPQVHALQHLRPVLCVCAPRARLCRPRNMSHASVEADAGQDVLLPSSASRNCAKLHVLYCHVTLR